MKIQKCIEFMKFTKERGFQNLGQVLCFYNKNKIKNETVFETFERIYC